MKTVTRVMTSDGVLHDTAKDAARHAEERYGNALTTLAAKAVKCEKYTAMLEFIDANLAAFDNLRALRNDREMAERRECSQCDYMGPCLTCPRCVIRTSEVS